MSDLQLANDTAPSGDEAKVAVPAPTTAAAAGTGAAEMKQQEARDRDRMEADESASSSDDEKSGKSERTHARLLPHERVDVRGAFHSWTKEGQHSHFRTIDEVFDLICVELLRP